MVKKMKSTDKDSKGSKTEAQHGNPLAASVKESAQQIWLAGMGAFSKAQEEGSKVFEALVKEGLNLQKKTQGIAEEKLGEVTGKVSAMADTVTAMADTVTAKAGQNWDKLEAIFEQRTAKAMGKLGVPTAKDVAELSARVDALAATVAKLSKGSAPKAAPVKASPVKAAVQATEAAVKKTARKTVKKVSKAVAETTAAVAEMVAEGAPAAPAKKAPAKRARKTAAA